MAQFDEVVMILLGPSGRYDNLAQAMGRGGRTTTSTPAGESLMQVTQPRLDIEPAAHSPCLIIGRAGNRLGYYQAKFESVSPHGGVVFYDVREVGCPTRFQGARPKVARGGRGAPFLGAHRPPSYQAPLPPTADRIDELCAELMDMPRRY